MVPEKRGDLATSVEWVKALAILIAGIGLILNVWEGHKNRVLQRRFFTAELIERFDDQLQIQARRAVMDQFPELAGRAEKTKFPVDMADDIYYSHEQNAHASLQDPRTLRENMHRVLNYFEDVSLAYDNGLAIKGHVEASLMDVMMRWHHYFETYIDYVADERKYEAWGPYNRIAKRWRADTMIDDSK